MAYKLIKLLTVIVILFIIVYLSWSNGYEAGKRYEQREAIYNPQPHIKLL